MGSSPTGGGVVVVVGSANLDTLIAVRHLPQRGETVSARSTRGAPGGKGLNQAVAAARQGATVRFVGCLGDDDAGESLRLTLETAGVDCGWLRVVPGASSGTATVTVAEDGSNTVVVDAGANARLRAADVDLAFDSLGGDLGVVLVQLEVPVAAVQRALERGRAAGAVNVLNPAPATGPLPEDLLELVDVLVPNETEAAALLGHAGSEGRPAPEAAAHELRRRGCRSVVVTLGERGATVLTAGDRVRVDAFPVRTVDTTGAGDAFCGTLAARLAAGGVPLDEEAVGPGVVAAVRRAAAAGALATAAEGAAPSLPDRAAVDQLMASSSIDGRRAEPPADAPAGAGPRPPAWGEAREVPESPARLWDELVHSRRHGPLPLGILAFTAVTGIVDAVSILALGKVFVANMTGNVVFVGFALAGGPGFSVERSLLSVAAFLFGAFTAGILAERTDVGEGDQPVHLAGRARLLAISASIELVTTVAITIVLAGARRPLATAWVDLSLAVLAAGLGSRNAFVGRIGVPGMTPNVLTTTITSIGFDLSKPNRQWANFRRRTVIVLTMFAGAVVGATLVLEVSAWTALALAAGVLAATVGWAWVLAAVAAGRRAPSHPRGRLAP